MQKDDCDDVIDLCITEEVRVALATVLKCGIYQALYKRKLLSDRELEILCDHNH